MLPVLVSISYSHVFLLKKCSINIYAISDDQRFNDMLTNYAISFEQLGLGVLQPFQHFLRHIEMMERMIIKVSVQ